jgi:hypothetical protein
VFQLPKPLSTLIVHCKSALFATFRAALPYSHVCKTGHTSTKTSLYSSKTALQSAGAPYNTMPTCNQHNEHCTVGADVVRTTAYQQQLVLQQLVLVLTRTSHTAVF